MKTIAVPQPFGPADAADWFDNWSDVGELPGLKLDLCEGEDLSPTGSVLIAAGVRVRRDRGLETVNSGALPDLPTMSDLRAARTLADEAGDHLEERLGMKQSSLLRAARFAFEELAANIVQHSGRSDSGFGRADVVGSEPRLQIAFADAGEGFRTSLQRNPEFEGRVADDGQAIQLALEKRVSRNGVGNLGIGLSFLKDLSDRLEADLWIASGSALLKRSGGERAGRTDELRTIAGWQGAWVCLDAPVDS